MPAHVTSHMTSESGVEPMSREVFNRYDKPEEASTKSMSLTISYNIITYNKLQYNTTPAEPGRDRLRGAPTSP